MITQLAIKDFLLCETPQTWIAQAINSLPLLLIDHAHCEKKAASTALSLIYRYVDKPELLHKMSRLAREELRHFEQVLAIIQKRGIAYGYLEPSKYATSLHAHVRTHEPAKLIDTLIVGAFIEARSCERFSVLAPHLDTELKKFYQSLLQSEARHYQDYLSLAELYAIEDIDDRVTHFAAIEANFIQSQDPTFRFHSGICS